MIVDAPDKVRGQYMGLFKDIPEGKALQLDIEKDKLINLRSSVYQWAKKHELKGHCTFSAGKATVWFTK